MMELGRSGHLARVVSLVNVRPAMDDKDHGHEDAPGEERARSASEKAGVEEDTDYYRAKDLTEPVAKIVQAAGADIKDGTVVIVKLPCVKIVRYEEHRKQQDDIWIGS